MNRNFLLFGGISLVLILGLGAYFLLSRKPLDTEFQNQPLVLETDTLNAVAVDADSAETVPSVSPAETGALPVQPTEESKPATPTKSESVPSAPASPAKSSGLDIVSRPIRFGYRAPSAPRQIDTIVLHSSYNAGDGDEYDLEKTIGQYETYGVGAHYIIDRKGTIYRLVDEANIAYHAGTSKMTDGRKNVNDFSIGIELIGTLESGFSDKQYSAVSSLLADIKSRYSIKSTVGHSDIAPGRKTDPWKFDWKKLNQ